FSIDEHVREIPRNIQTDEDLQAYVSALISTELTLTRPLRTISKTCNQIREFGGVYHL
ncbi:unnamed protein product, partial [Rotaria sordida]